MGSSSSKEQKIEAPPQININIDLGGLKQIISSVNNGSTRMEESNSFRILDDGDAPPTYNNQEQPNSYNNQTYKISFQSRDGKINIPINKFINNNSIESPNQNKDNNIKGSFHNENNGKNTNNENKINPNIKYNVNLNIKKETSKGSKNKEEINPNMGKFNGRKEEVFTKPSNPDNNIGNNYNPDNYKFFTKTGNEENTGKESSSPEGNKDNNEIHESMRHPLDNSNNIEEENNKLSQSVLVASFQNLNITDPNDLIKFKKMATQKYNDGFYALFVKMDHKICYYYIKLESNLQSLLLGHLNNLKIPYTKKNYSFYNRGIKLNPNIPINDLDIPILSVIEIKEV